MEPGGQSCGGGGGRDGTMAGGVSEARFAGLSLVQLNELLEDEGQLTEMVQKMEEVSRAAVQSGCGGASRGARGAGGPRRAGGGPRRRRSRCFMLG